MAQRKARTDAHQAITDQIITMLESAKGIADCPWYRAGNITRPGNAATGKPYQGVNVLALWASSTLQGFESGLWATYRQWASIGAQVRKGEKGTHTVFYKTLEQEDDNGDEVTIPFARSKAVFAAEQVDGFELPTMPTVNRVETHAAAEALIQASGAVIEHGGAQAFYQRSTDRITMPDKVRFRDTEAYFAVLLHELIHWAGAVSRCDRSAIKSYAFEELVAELGAAFLCADLGISATPREDHAEYLASWLTELRDDPKALVKASRMASQAAQYLQEKHLRQSHTKSSPNQKAATA